MQHCRSVAVATAFVTVFLMVSATNGVSGWNYLPGVEPLTRKAEEEVNIRVNALRSAEALVPYSYYRLPFCKPSKVMDRPEALGELLFGDLIESSLYTVSMAKDEACRLVTCDAGSDDLLKANINEVERFITDGYRAGMSIDNLPSFNNGSRLFNGRSCTKGDPIPADQLNLYQRGYAIGVHKGCVGETLINNHLEFRIQYHRPTNDTYRVVGFTITPYSIEHAADGNDCVPTFNPNDEGVKALTTESIRNGNKTARWSFGVKWVEEPGITWATRWDAYLNTSFADTNNRVHWLYIINSLLITLCLCIIATMSLLRALRKDFTRYNTENPDDVQEEVGWKLSHADVFRPPPRCGTLAVLIGTGVQVVLMALATLFFALLGFLSPANRGGLLTTLLLLFVLMAFVAGYTTGRLLKMFDAKEWKTVFATGLAFPAVGFFAWIVVELFVGSQSTLRVGALTTFMVLGLWIGISLPLVVLGASFAFRQETITNPVKVGKLAREIPAQRWYYSPPFTFIVPALIPLGAAFLELKFILLSLWQGMVYYVFGFFSLVFFVWLLTVALTTVIVIYYQLCYEDYRWWWRSLIIPGGAGVHLFVYCTYFFFTQLNVTHFSGAVVYFAYMGLVSMAYGLAAGTIGFFCAFLFIRKIYGSIKIE